MLVALWFIQGSAAKTPLDKTAVSICRRRLQATFVSCAAAVARHRSKVGGARADGAATACGADADSVTRLREQPAAAVASDRLVMDGSEAPLSRRQWKTAAVQYAALKAAVQTALPGGWIVSDATVGNDF